jgi:1D-myo-inositol-tetrakisphosphate 5-kinase/inositol-polyphosphate multikinase
VLARVYEAQASWHFFSASLLVVYEGAAAHPDQADPRVTLIDFAHTFPVVGDGAASGPSGRDQNFLDGLTSLTRVLQDLVG